MPRERHNAGVTPKGTSRRAQVLSALHTSRLPVDDDQIARIASMDRHHVNTICRQLAADRVITRYRGADGKLVNALITTDTPATPAEAPSSVQVRRTPRRDKTRNVESLIANFAGWVEAFERSQAFPGPSLYFHERAIERRRLHTRVTSLLDDERFLEYVYAGMKVSTSGTQIVAGSKFLHHLLPDLVPPIDRQYTFTFFTGQKAVPNDRVAFGEWLPRFAEIGRRCREPIAQAVDRGGFMATGEAKVIDNAIMGYLRQPVPTDDLTAR